MLLQVPICPTCFTSQSQTSGLIYSDRVDGNSRPMFQRFCLRRNHLRNFIPISFVLYKTWEQGHLTVFMAGMNIMQTYIILIGSIDSENKSHSIIELWGTTYFRSETFPTTVERHSLKQINPNSYNCTISHLADVEPLVHFSPRHYSELTQHVFSTCWTSTEETDTN